MVCGLRSEGNAGGVGEFDWNDRYAHFYEGHIVNFAEELVVASMKHRDCGIRTASYEVAPHAWLPEACVWLQTESGLRRLWIHSFAHCFDANKLTFTNKVEADTWAVGAARAIVDRALDKAEFTTASRAAKAAKPFASMWQLRRYSTLVLSCFKLFR